MLYASGYRICNTILHAEGVPHHVAVADFVDDPVDQHQLKHAFSVRIELADR